MACHVASLGFLGVAGLLTWQVALQRAESKAFKLPRAWGQRPQNVTYATFYWSIQVTNPDSRGGVIDPTS